MNRRVDEDFCLHAGSELGNDLLGLSLFSSCFRQCAERGQVRIKRCNKLLDGEITS